MNQKIENALSALSSFEKLRFFKRAEDDKQEKKEDKSKGVPVLEGISFRFKTVQFHIVDDAFEEIKKKPEIFGDVKILSERFSLPKWGREIAGALSKDEFQFEVIAKIISKVDRETYRERLNEVLDKIGEKHNVEVIVEGDEEYYNVNKIIFHTDKDGVFEKG